MYNNHGCKKPSNPKFYSFQPKSLNKLLKKRDAPTNFSLHLDLLILIEHDCDEPCFKLFVAVCCVAYNIMRLILIHVLNH